MFNGIVQSRGKVFKIHFGKDNFVDIKTKLDLHSTGIGSSLSCNGICLTIINKKKICYTWYKINFGLRKILERPFSQFFIM